ncbi:hypothetical protein PHLGIDRAFT_309253 [Phlebiopsis gigantea 11061_1 CR5-6]|uniref:Uncharacterized protein n=1 Tax=Phlebiopsis gigantea (strain 11061_1 CR5-6) TaxID=745531 RepID=A0A0C3NC97_PHLG1|nr:hypothetical protein PHLGIDRAFT_309253 [Phlebiopsis gigantea 11061_1 CR5-6]
MQADLANTPYATTTMVPILDIVKTPTLFELTPSAGRIILPTIRAGFQLVLLPFLSFALSFRLIRVFVDFVVFVYQLHYGHSTSLVSELARTSWAISDIGRSMYSFLNSSAIEAPDSLLPLGLQCLPFDNSTTYRVCTSAAFVDRIAGYARDVLAVPAWDELLILCIFHCISVCPFYPHSVRRS